MYIVIVNKTKLPVLQDLFPEISKMFPEERFTIHGSEGNDYALWLEGSGCERQPRAFAEAFIKKWKPSLA